MVFKNELYPIHFYGRVRGKCDGRLQNWPGIVNERPKFLAMYQPTSSEVGTNAIQHLVFLDVHFYSSSGTFELGIIKKSLIALPVKIKMQ